MYNKYARAQMHLVKKTAYILTAADLDVNLRVQKWPAKAI